VLFILLTIVFVVALVGTGAVMWDAPARAELKNPNILNVGNGEAEILQAY
jgi:hypothetical protein